MKEKHNLRDSKIYIDDDLTKREREIQQKIREKMRQEKNKGNNAVMGYKKLIVNGEKWIWSEQQMELRKVS